MKNIHFKTCTCLLGILLILFSGITGKGSFFGSSAGK